MALKVDKKDGSVGSLDVMRIQVIFKRINALKDHVEAKTADMATSLWVADSIGDLPCIGDHILLEDTTDNGFSATSVGYKVSARSIDLNGFIKNGSRIVCTINLETAAS